MDLKKLLILVLAVVMCVSALSVAGCVNPGVTPTVPSTGDGVSVEVPTYVNEKFSTIGLDMNASTFETLGFTPGDSVNLRFSNGVEIDDIPYVTGVFVKNGQIILLSRSAATLNTLEIVRVNTGDEWYALGVTPGDNVTVTLGEKQKYAITQRLNKLKYGTDKSKFANTEEFTNFRAMKGGDLKDNYIYRGASAIDNTGKRVADVNRLLEQNGIRTLIDMADSDETIAKMQNKEGHDAPYFDKLYEEGNVVALGMSTAFASEKFKEQMAECMRQIIERDGPFYIFCLEGKNRTGVAGIILEALAGASYEEIEADYMETYKNYYKITKASEPQLYDQIVELKFVSSMQAFSNGSKSADLYQDARDYLNSGGMTDEELDALVAKITN